MIALAIRIPVVDGAIDLSPPANVKIHRSADDKVIAFSHGDNTAHAALKYVGVYNGDAIFTGMASKNVAQWLVRQGMTVARLKDLTAAQKTWLAARGVTPENAGHSICGWPAGDTDEV